MRNQHAPQISYSLGALFSELLSGDKQDDRAAKERFLISARL